MKLSTLTQFRKVIKIWGETRYETDDTGNYSLIPIAVSNELDNLLMLAKKDFGEQDAKARRKGKPAGRPALDLPSSYEIGKKLLDRSGKVKRGALKELARELRCSKETLRTRLKLLNMETTITKG